MESHPIYLLVINKNRNIKYEYVSVEKYMHVYSTS